MNWDMLSEKLSKDNKTVVIFYDKNDVDDNWLVLRVKSYQDKGIPTITRIAKAKQK